MHRWLKIIFAIFAVLTLVGYLLGDLVLAGGPEMMSWEEFSANPRAVAQFRERMAEASTDAQAADDMHRAYDRYRDSVVDQSGGSAGRGSVSQGVLDLRSGMRRIYLAWVPPGGFHAMRHQLWSIGLRERIGAGLTLFLVCVIIAAFTFAIRLSREKARA